jgi:hypothetical protein
VRLLRLARNDPGTLSVLPVLPTTLSISNTLFEMLDSFDKREVRLGTRKTKDGSMEYEWLPMNKDLYDNLFW